MTESTWRGFYRPHYTQVPDDLFDELMPDLSEAELKVLLYIIRRTFGFDKESDRISLRQMVEGITTRDGRVLDRGTGLSRSSVVKAVKSLIERDIITCERQQALNGDSDVNVYALRLCDD